MNTQPVSRDTVFVAGGQPSVTYVERAELHIERDLARALAAPNHIVSLSGPTKCGKTVLCRRVLGERPYVWVEGGQMKNAGQIWERVCYELNYPVEITKTSGSEAEGKLEFGIAKLFMTAGGSRLSSKETSRTYRIDTMASALRHLIENDILLVIDDFHYPNEETRREFLRNVKGSVFNGLRVLLLSVTHRAFDAIKAESELTGRFSAITVPEWSLDDLRKIPEKGFTALNISCPESTVSLLSREAQESPFLVQKFCWEICFDLNVDIPAFQLTRVPAELDIQAMFERISKSAGLPIYEKLVAGPQSRKVRLKRPLKTGDSADVYQATLLAIAETGPESAVSYEQIRSALSNLLLEKVPQKHEITSALKHLSKISSDMGTDTAIDWDDGKRQVNISDPYLRFYLRWQVRRSLDSALFRS